MIIGIPTMGKGGLGSLVGEHFGRVPTYTLVNPDTMEIRIIDNTSEHMGGAGYPPDLLKREGVEILLCRGLGKRAVQMFDENGICVFIGAQGSAEEAVGLWKEGRLQEASLDNACGRHAFRSQHHGRHHH